jgi:alkylation response protein AidB-like acyl-CoA dehydrogenase
MLKQVAADFIKTEALPDQITRLYQEGVGYMPELYRQAAEMGWLGMTVPEEYGGASTSLTDCAVVFEELGRGPLPGPYFSSGVLGALTVLEAGSEEQKQTWLPRVCSGESILTLAISDVASGWGPEAVEMRGVMAGGEITLSGNKPFVHDVDGATALICAVRLASERAGVTLLLVDKDAPGVSVHPQHGSLAAVAEVRFESVRVPESRILGQIGAGWQALDRALERAIPILCAYKVGACQEIFEFTTEYTRTRVVFGQPIGRFQRVQDHCVDLSIHMDAARWVTYETLWKLDTGLTATASVHEAKAVASEAYYQVCNYAHMVHAGPGTDYTHPLMPHSVMSRTLYQYLGAPMYHKQRMMDILYPAGAPSSP